MRYRYLTPVLAGIWRPSAEEACADAVAARQAERNEDGTIGWRDWAKLDVDARGERAVKRASSRR